MRLTVLGSGSSGNGYLLEGRDSALLLECGVRPEAMMRLTDIPVSKIAAAFVTHEHADHAGYMDRYANLGLPIYASRGTFEAGPKLGAYASRRPIAAMQTVRVGRDWTVRAFDTRHDAAEPLGFIVEAGRNWRLLFLTDTACCPYNFRNLCLQHIMVEANWCDRLLDENVASGEVTPERAERTRRTHMSIQGACDLIRADQTAELETVTLIHLSRSNADPKDFARRAAETALFARIYTAAAGLTVDLEKDRERLF